jgi:hypothetical protein
MDDLAELNEKRPKRTGWKEIVGGGAAGVLAGGVAGNAKFIRELVSDNIQDILAKSYEAGKAFDRAKLTDLRSTARKAFMEQHPQPTVPTEGAPEFIAQKTAELQQWFKDLHKVGKDTIKSFFDKAFAEMKMKELGAIYRDSLPENAGFIKKIIHHPIFAFKHGGLQTKVVLGSIVAASALAVGYGIHKFRNRHVEKKAESFVERGEQERQLDRSVENARA